MTTLEKVAAVIGAIMLAARITRLLVFDVYPPVAWLRVKWDNLTGRSTWNVLLHCGYCASVWITAAVMAFALWLLPVSVPFSHASTWFWLAAGWLGGAYAVAYVVAYDGDD